MRPPASGSRRPLQCLLGLPRASAAEDALVVHEEAGTRAHDVIALLWGHFTYFQEPDSSKVECPRQTNVDIAAAMGYLDLCDCVAV